MILNDPFLGNQASTSICFSGTDTEDRFLKNSKVKDSTWYYADKKIIYEYNYFGHRCQNQSEINFDNYILFAGCSHSEGIGLELEKTYPYLVSKELGLDYYNLAASGCGLDALEYNIYNWFFSVPKKPRCLIVQWPDHSRFLSSREGYENFLEEGSWSNDSYVRTFIELCEEHNIFTARKKVINDLMHQVIDLPIINVQHIHMDLANNHEYVPIIAYDLARDFVHPGIKSHRIIAESLVEHIKNL